jgi:hypothetical protein
MSLLFVARTIADMSDGLFDLGNVSPHPAEDMPARARDEQVSAIRRALDDAGLESQDARRGLVESVILAEVNSLRELTALQARRVLDRLKAERSTEALGGSSWDNRDHDTWIDKM